MLQYQNMVIHWYLLLTYWYPICWIRCSIYIYISTGIRNLSANKTGVEHQGYIWYYLCIWYLWFVLISSTQHLYHKTHTHVYIYIGYDDVVVSWFHGILSDSTISSYTVEYVMWINVDIPSDLPPIIVDIPLQMYGNKYVTRIDVIHKYIHILYCTYKNVSSSVMYKWTNSCFAAWRSDWICNLLVNLWHSAMRVAARTWRRRGVAWSGGSSPSGASNVWKAIEPAITRGDNMPCHHCHH